MDIFESKKCLASAKTHCDKHLIQNKNMSNNQQKDGSLHVVYDLTDYEMKVVEGKV
jgi:hypothetical protein